LSVNSQREIDWFKSQDINGIIHNSSHAIDECGRRYFHQRRITKKAIFRAENNNQKQLEIDIGIKGF